MSNRAFRRIAIAGLFAAVMAAASPGRALAAGPRTVAQFRINEWAAGLLRAHRALIEDPGLRLPGEPLEVFTERIAAPLPGETEARYRERVDSYVASVQRAADVHRLCVALPVLHDTDASNVALWRKAVEASGHLHFRAAKVRETWLAFRHRRPNRTETRRLGMEIAQTLLVLKTAYEALRDARP
jgi:hypothetical protein